MKISDTKFVVLDTETTGLVPGEDKVVEISLVEVSKRGIRPLYDTLIDPERDIPAVASAVHHITAKDVQGKPKFDEVWPVVMSHVQDAVIVAHNAAFDRSMVPETGRPWLCTLRLARHLWPDAPGHSNQVLRYWLNLDVDAGAPHSATADTLVTAHVLFEALKAYRADHENNVEELLAYTNGPIQVKKMPFGKHRGEDISELPLDYVDWALRNLTDMDVDLRWTLEHYVSVAQSQQEGTAFG